MPPHLTYYHLSPPPFPLFFSPFFPLFPSPPPILAPGVDKEQEEAAMEVITRVASLTPSQLARLDPQTRTQVLLMRRQLGIPEGEEVEEKGSSSHTITSTTLQQKPLTGSRQLVGAKGSSSRGSSSTRNPTTSSDSKIPVVAVSLDVGVSHTTTTAAARGSNSSKEMSDDDNYSQL